MTHHLNTIIAIQSALNAANVGFSTYLLMSICANRTRPLTLAELSIAASITYKGTTRQVYRNPWFSVAHTNNRSYITLTAEGRAKLRDIARKIARGLRADWITLAMSDTPLTIQRPTASTYLCTVGKHSAAGGSIIEAIATLESQLADHNTIPLLTPPAP